MVFSFCVERQNKYLLVKTENYNEIFLTVIQMLPFCLNQICSIVLVSGIAVVVVDFKI